MHAEQHGRSDSIACDNGFVCSRCAVALSSSVFCFDLVHRLCACLQKCVDTAHGRALVTTVSSTVDAALSSFVLSWCNVTKLRMAEDVEDEEHFRHDQHAGIKLACHIATGERFVASHIVDEKIIATCTWWCW